MKYGCGPFSSDDMEPDDGDHLTTNEVYDRIHVMLDQKAQFNTGSPMRKSYREALINLYKKLVIMEDER